MLRRILALLACAAATAAGIAAASPARGAAAQAGHAGRWLVDGSGRVLVLHGVNMVAKRPPYLPSQLGFDEEDARWLRAQGFSTVRLGIILTGLEPQQGAFQRGYLDDIVHTIGELHAAGLLVLVDFHQDYFSESTGGEGFPPWMVRRRAPLPPQLGGGRADGPPWDAFWANDGGVQDAFADAWRYVAQRLVSVPGVLGYDLVNEPFPGAREQECAKLEGCPSFDRDVLAPFYRRVIAAVRGIDAEHLVFYEPHVIFNQGAASSIGALGDPRAAFSFHVYCSERPTTPPCTTRRPRAFTNAAEQAARGDDALLMTEFGATDDLAELGRVLDLADEHMVGWQEWAYWNQDPCCARDHEGLIRTLDRPPEGENVKADKLAVLARPYPRAIAGTPLRWSWKDGVFEAAWSTARAGGGRLRRGLATEIELPPAAFPAGFRMSINGGTVRTPRGTRVLTTLRVVANKGAREVTVRVEKR